MVDGEEEANDALAKGTFGAGQTSKKLKWTRKMLFFFEDSLLFSIGEWNARITLSFRLEGPSSSTLDESFWSFMLSSSMSANANPRSKSWTLQAIFVSSKLNGLLPIRRHLGKNLQGLLL